MTFLAPWWLAGGFMAALALVGLHLLAIGRPAPLLLPTARFVPQRSARARRIARRPTDLLLLALRVVTVLLAATALARPVRTPKRRPVARVIVADRSRAVASAEAVRDSVRVVAGAGDLLVAFDMVAASPVALGATPAARDSAIAAALVPTAGDSARPPAAGSLSAALAAARRSADRLRDSADSIELVVVAPLTSHEVDAATAGVRATWAGRARVVRVPAAVDGAAPRAVRVVARGGATVSDDALAAAATLLGAGGGARSNVTGRVGSVPQGSARSANVEVGGGAPLRLETAAGGSSGSSRAPDSQAAPPAVARIVRSGTTAADSAWARDSAGVLLDWPLDGVPAEWARRARVDTSGAVVAGTVAFVMPMARRAEWAVGTESGQRRAEGVAVIAQWADGTSAALERATATGCTRSVAVPVPQVGDAALRPPFLALLGALTGACAAHAVGAPLDTNVVRALAGAGPLLATATLAKPPAADDPIARWLLAAALVLLLVELPVRFVGRQTMDSVATSTDARVDSDAPSAGQPREAA